MKHISNILIVILLSVIAYLLFQSKKDGDSFHQDLKTAKAAIELFKADIAAREFIERKRLDTIKVLKSQRVEALNKAVKAENKARYYYAKSIIKPDVKDTAEFLVALEESNKLKDSAYQEMDTANTDLKKALVACNQENIQKDSVISELKLDKKDLGKIDSIHVDLLNKSIDHGRKKFWKGLGIGGSAGVVITLLILL